MQGFYKLHVTCKILKDTNDFQVFEKRAEIE